MALKDKLVSLEDLEVVSGNVEEELSDLREALYADFTFEQGTINGTTGAYEESANTIRTTLDSTSIKALYVSCDKGYRYAVRYYDKYSSFIGYLAFDNAATLIQFPENAVKVGICLRSLYSNISPDASSHIHITIHPDTIIDAFNELSFNDPYFQLTFEQGTINGSTGAYEDSINTIRTTFDAIGITSITVSCKDFYSTAIRAFNDYGALLDITTFQPNEVVFEVPSGTAKIGVCLRKTDGNAITYLDSGNINIELSKNAFIDAIDARLDKIEEETSDIVDDTFADKIASIADLSATSNCVNIGFITDTHENLQDASEAVKTFQNIQATKMMDVCVHCGDLITSYDFTHEECVKAVIKSIPKYKKNGEVLFVVGNHDDNHTGTSEEISDTEYYTLFLKDAKNSIHKKSNPFTTYYYYDITPNKVRIIVLDSFATQGSEDINFGSDQVAWMYGTALQVEDGWTVVVFSHGFSTAKASTNNVLKAFANRGTTYGTYTFPTDKTTHFVGVIHGHNHTDDDNTSTLSTDVFNIIGVRNAFGTEWGVDVFTIDTVNNVLHESRFGTGNDRTFSYT